SLPPFLPHSTLPLSISESAISPIPSPVLPSPLLSHPLSFAPSIPTFSLSLSYVHQVSALIVCLICLLFSDLNTSTALQVFLPYLKIKPKSVLSDAKKRGLSSAQEM